MRPLAFGGKLPELRHQPPSFVEKLLRPIAAQPLLQQRQMRRIFVHLSQRHLMGAPEALDLVTVDLFGTAPPFGAAQDHHRPPRPLDLGPGSARLLLDTTDFPYAVFEGRRHRLMHSGRIGALHEIRLVAIAAEQRLQLVMRDAGEDWRVGDLVPVQMQHRQHRAVASGIEELVRVPRRRQRAGFRLAIADHHGHDQIWVVEGCAVGMRHRIAELSTFVYRTRRLRRAG